MVGPEVGAVVGPEVGPDVGAVVGPDVGAVVGVVVGEHLPSKPEASCFTFATRPLVGIVRSQSGGLAASTAASRLWQASDAHILTYWASVGSAVANRRL